MRAVRSKKRGKIKRRLIILSALLFISIGAWIFFACNINPVISTVSLEEIRAMTTVAVNSAASEIMNGNINYGDIMKIEKNASGEITAISADPVIVNKLARDVTLVAQSNLASIGEQGIQIPLGTLTGFSLFSGIGPNITIKALPVGYISTSFKSEFTSTGINQTRHQILMLVNANVSIVIPGMTREVAIKTDVLISENIIVGKVPDTYLNSDTLTEMLNLIP